MATVYDTFATDYVATPRVLATPCDQHGVAQLIRFHYEASSLASGSTIQLGTPVPAGARVYEIVVLADDLGTTAGTLEVGDAGDTDRFISAYATGSATFKQMTKDGRIDNLYYQYTADTQLQITTAGATISGTIRGHILYALV